MQKVVNNFRNQIEVLSKWKQDQFKSKVKSHPSMFRNWLVKLFVNCVWDQLACFLYNIDCPALEFLSGSFFKFKERTEVKRCFWCIKVFIYVLLLNMIKFFISLSINNFIRNMDDWLCLIFIWDQNRLFLFI